MDRRAPDPANTAEQILAAARELVERRGYHAFSYRDVAERVGIRPASIHYYYPSKGDLAEAVLARARLDFERALPGSPADPGERLRRFAELFVRTLGEGERLCPFCMIAMAQDSVPEAVRVQVRTFWAGAEQWVAGVLEEGRSTGRFAFAGPAGVPARALLAALEGAMVAARVFGEPARVRECVEHELNSLLPARGGTPARPTAGHGAVPAALNTGGE